MMCDTTNRSFRAQLGAILEKLTKAYLVEISDLADECSSALHTEISQSRSENEALKKRCFSLEIQLRAARGSSGSHNNHNYPTNNATSNSSNNHVSHRNNSNSGTGTAAAAAGASEKFVRDQQQPAQPAPAIDGIFGKDWCMDLWREKLPPPGKGTTEEASTLRNNGPPVPPQAVDLMDGEPDLIFVKEETYEDQPIGQQMRLSDNRKRLATIEEDGTDQRAVNELRLHQGGLNNFPVTSAQPQQGAPPMLMDGLIEGSPMANLVDDTNRSSAGGEYSDFMNNMQSNATKELAIQQHRAAGKVPKQFECLFCGKVFNYLSSLKVHIRRHSGEKPFSCTVCGKRFAQKTYLKLHQRVHSGEKPYSCLECGRSFSQKSSLNMHLRTHTGEKPYSCVDCGKSYAYKYGFNQHKCFN